MTYWKYKNHTSKIDLESRVIIYKKLICSFIKNSCSFNYYAVCEALINNNIVSNEFAMCHIIEILQQILVYNCTNNLR